MHGIKSVVYHVHKRFIKLKNIFSYEDIFYTLSDGSENNNKEHTYSLLIKKAYSDRFDTACWGDLFKNRIKRSEVGLSDVPVFRGTKATLDELRLCHSYFLNMATSDIIDFRPTVESKVE